MDTNRHESKAGSTADRIRRILAIVFLCRLFRDHDWTCAAEQGIAPTKKQVADGVYGFFDYAKMYCRRCGRESQLSERSRRES